MTSGSAPLVPPFPPVHPHRLPSFVALWMVVRNNLSNWPRQAFEEPIRRSRFFGADVLVVSDPAGVRHVLNEAADKYRRPVMASRALRPIGGSGVFLVDGAQWRRQRKMLSPLFTPASVGLLVPHFHAAADYMLRRIEGANARNLSRDFQDAALDSVFRALFSLPEAERREKLGAMARLYLEGVGRPMVFDIFAREEVSFAFFSRGRWKFRMQWQEAVDALIAERRAAPRAGAGRDLLDLLLAVRDPETGEGISTVEIRDQCATMLVAGFETTARLMFWLCYLLALDPDEQDRIRAEFAAFPPERAQSLDDLGHWPRLRMAMFEALRLYPPAPHVLREAVADDVICGERIAPGAQIWLSAWIIHRHRRFWERPGGVFAGALRRQNKPVEFGRALHALRRRPPHLHRRGLRARGSGDRAGPFPVALSGCAVRREAGAADRGGHDQAEPGAGFPIGASLGAGAKIHNDGPRPWLNPPASASVIGALTGCFAKWAMARRRSSIRICARSRVRP
nr:cytochrome P450 [Candidatus Rhodoblastus alkanivorans]